MTSQQQPEQQRLLGVFAHPDDETIGAGGLLALAVAAGVDVSVVTCTRGERGDVIPPDLAHLRSDRDALAREREEELSSALAELGVHRHLYLDQVPALEDQRPARLRDSGMRWLRPGLAGPAEDAGPEAFTAVDLDVAALLLAVVIRHVRPTAVLTEEPGGGYGHPDHVRAHDVTTRAVELAAAEDPEVLPGLAPWRVPTVLWVAQEEDHLRAATAELRDTLAGHAPLHSPDGAALTVPDDVTELPSIAVPAAQVTASFDVRPVAGRLLAALRRHRTQVQAVAPVDGQRLVGYFALSNDVLSPLLDRVHLRTAPGDDATDLLLALSAVTPAVPGGAPQDGADDAPGATVHQLPPPTAGFTPEQAATLVRSTGSSSTAHVGRSGLARGDDERPARPRASRLAPSGGATGAVVAVLAGIVMAMLGTVVHRYAIEGWPVGLVLGLAGVLSAAIAARAIAGSGGLLLTVLAVVVMTQAMAFLRPGGDVLVTNEAVSYVWLFGAPLVCLAAAFLPRRWFSDGRQR